MYHSIINWLSDTNNASNTILITLGVVFGGLIIKLGFIEEDPIAQDKEN